MITDLATLVAALGTTGAWVAAFIAVMMALSH